jgi:hypothetical protein
VAGTLSHYRTPSTLFTGASIFDGSFNIDSRLLNRNIKFIAESLAQHVYGLGVTVTERAGGLGADEVAAKAKANTNAKATNGTVGATAGGTVAVVEGGGPGQVMEQAMETVDMRVEVVRGSTDINPEFIEKWMNLVGRYAATPPT